MASWRWWRRAAAPDGELAALRQEVERLTQENMRLRLEQQRPRNLSAVTDLLRAAVEQPAEADALEARDEAHHVAARTEATRRAVVDVLHGLVVAAGQLQRQLTEDVALTEIDRRVVERRGPRQRGEGFPLTLVQDVAGDRDPAGDLGPAGDLEPVPAEAARS
ncbi:hypothetical protein NUM3379_41480 [Kineococcus sp. NUM-3379]